MYDVANGEQSLREKGEGYGRDMKKENNKQEDPKPEPEKKEEENKKEDPRPAPEKKE